MRHEREALLGNVAEQANKLHCCRSSRENTSLKAQTVAVLTIDQ
jgi:hypothetical protein